MTPMARLTLMFVVFVDLIGQGLVFPIINAMLMQTSSTFLPSDTPMGMRHFYYGLVIGSFFLSWFLGVVYVSRLSDSIGRKSALMICLGGALVGYAITIAALFTNSVLLLVLGRSITGFTAGNQPIAKAAMVDHSGSDAERDRNIGYVVTGVSFGLVGGPIIGALLSDHALLGDYATFKMPFYGAMVMVLIAMVLVQLFLTDVSRERQPVRFRLRDITDSLLAVRDHPKVLRLLPVYSLFMTANVTFYVFADNYLTSAFGYGVVGGSVVMVVIGTAVAMSSSFLVQPAQERFSKRMIVAVALAVMVLSGLAFTVIGNGVLIFVPPFLFYFLFGISYPTILGLFSSSVGDADQGWVMGVTTAVFTLAGGVMSLIGGGLMSIDIRLPYYLVMGFAMLGLVALFAMWRKGEMQ